MDEIKDDAGFTAWPSRTCHQPLTDELRAGVTEARASSLWQNTSW